MLLCFRRWPGSSNGKLFRKNTRVNFIFSQGSQLHLVSGEFHSIFLNLHLYLSLFQNLHMVKNH